MASRESGRPGSEQTVQAIGNKETATNKQTPAQKENSGSSGNKPEAVQHSGHSPADARLKSFEQTIDPNGTVRIKKDYYETIPEPSSATEMARVKTAEAGRTVQVDAKLKPTGASVDITSAPGKENATSKTESVETGKETPASSAQAVEAVKKDPQTPPEVKKALEHPENAKAAAAAVDNKTVGGSKLKKIWGAIRPALAGFAAGAAARVGIRYFAMRALDMGTVGAGAIAGGAVGGGMEFYKSFRSETKRLYDMKTYTDALTDYDTMETDLERVKALVAVEAALKENIKSKKLSPTQRAEYGAKLQYLRTKLETAKQEGWEQKTGADKIKLLLKYRSQADGEQLKLEELTDVQKNLESFQKERKLKRDGWKIARRTLYGVAVGAAGGALGAYAFEHWINPHLGSYAAPDMPGAHEAGMPGGVNGADALHGAAGHGTENIIHVPSGEDAQELHKTVWETCKQYMIDHGVADPSNHDVNEAMIRICKENGIEISGHHNVADFAGFHHEHFKDLVDVKLHNGMGLHGFDKISDIVQHAGGHAQGVQEIITHVPGGLAAEANKQAVHDWLIKDAAKHLAEEDHHLRNIWLLVGGSAAAGGALVGGGYWLRKHKGNKGGEAEDPNRSMRMFGDLNPAQERPVELMGGDLKDAGLEKRIQVLGEIKTEALGRIAKAGMCLEGNSPDLDAFQKALFLVGAVYNPEQLEHLSQGASAADSTKITAAWRAMEQELRDAVMPLGAIAQRLMEEEYERNAADSEAEQDYLDDGDDDGSKVRGGFGATPKKTTKAEKEGSWAGVYDFGRGKINKAVANGEQALAQDKIGEAESYYLDAVTDIDTLARFARGLKSKENKSAKNAIKALEKKIDSLREQIEAAKKKSPDAKIDKSGGGIAGTKTSRDLEAGKLGIEGWELKYYHQMQKLRLIRILPEGQKLLPGDKDRDRLGKFILLAKEEGSIFESLTKGGARKLRGDFLEALTMLKEANNPDPLKDFCLLLLQKGESLGKTDAVRAIFQEMDNIGTEVKTVIDKVVLDFSTAKKKKIK